ncbi:MAG: hypothetical protein ABIP48_02825 [Planctomycetota bacterium]
MIARMVAVLCCIFLMGQPGWGESEGQEGCRVVQEGNLVEICSPAFVFRLDTTAGLRAESWESRLTGRRITLDGGELEIDVDTADQRIGITGWKFECMEAVYGMAERGQARQSFLRHVRGRSRRVLRGHDKAYAIFEPFGALPVENYNENEQFLLDNIAKLAEGQRQTGYHFDYYSVDFWEDYRGDRRGFDAVRFPNGLAKINQELKKLGTAPGLWVDITGPRQSIGGNPAIQPTLNHDPQYGTERLTMCLATEPIKSINSAAFCHHLRENGVRLFKFDGYWAMCHNPSHDHLPGVYATEAIHPGGCRRNQQRLGADDAHQHGRLLLPPGERSRAECHLATGTGRKDLLSRFVAGMADAGRTSDRAANV